MGVHKMKYIVTVNGNRYEVEVEAEQGEVAITDPDLTTDKSNTPSPNQSSTPENIEGEVITAPMPGKILAVKASNGQSIKKGDVLFVLEAMKMENEIMAPRDGVVSGIFVQRDTTVNVGDKLGSIS